MIAKLKVEDEYEAQESIVDYVDNMKRNIAHLQMNIQYCVGFVVTMAQKHWNEGWSFKDIFGRDIDGQLKLYGRDVSPKISFIEMLRNDVNKWTDNEELAKEIEKLDFKAMLDKLYR